MEWLGFDHTGSVGRFSGFILLIFQVVVDCLFSHLKLLYTFGPMNKRIFFILLPILALLFNTSDVKGTDFKSFPKESGSGFVSQASAQSTIPSSSDLKNGSGKVNRNAIRIKANNGALELDIPKVWSFATRAVYLARLVFGIYNIYTADAHPAIYNLRGPPPFTV